MKNWKLKILKEFLKNNKINLEKNLNWEFKKDNVSKSFKKFGKKFKLRILKRKIFLNIFLTSKKTKKYFQIFLRFLSFLNCFLVKYDL